MNNRRGSINPSTTIDRQKSKCSFDKKMFLLKCDFNDITLIHNDGKGRVGMVDFGKITGQNIGKID